MIINDASLAALKVAYGDAFKGAFDGATTEYEKVTTLVPSSNESNLYAWLGQFPQMREWLGDRQAKSVKANGYQVTNKTFEATVKVPREKIEDDVFQIYTPMMQEMGVSAKQHPDELVFQLAAAGHTNLCYDGQNFLDTNHPSTDASSNAILVDNYDATGAGNLWYLLDTRRPLKPFLFQKRREYKFTAMVSDAGGIGAEHVFLKNEYVYGVDCRVAAAYGIWQAAYGSLNTLNGTNVNAYLQKMFALKSDQGKPLGIKPNICLVGPSNFAAARNVFMLPTQPDSAAANPNFGLCEVVMTPYLT